MNPLENPTFDLHNQHPHFHFLKCTNFKSVLSILVNLRLNQGRRKEKNFGEQLTETPSPLSPPFGIGLQGQNIKYKSQFIYLSLPLQNESPAPYIPSFKMNHSLSLLPLCKMNNYMMLALYLHTCTHIYHAKDPSFEDGSSILIFNFT